MAPGDYLEGHPRTAELLVEVADTTLPHDRGKAGLYAAAGVAEYWILNLREGVIEVYRQPQEGAYTRVTCHGRGDQVQLVRFPDVQVPVSEVLPPLRAPRAT